MLMLADASPHIHCVVEFTSILKFLLFFFVGFPISILVKDDFLFVGFTAAVKWIACGNMLKYHMLTSQLQRPPVQFSIFKKKKNTFETHKNKPYTN